MLTFIVFIALPVSLLLVLLFIRRIALKGVNPDLRCYTFCPRCDSSTVCTGYNDYACSVLECKKR